MTVEKVRRRESLRSDLDQALRGAEASGDVLEGIDRFGEKAMKMILSPRARTAFDTSRESPAFAKLFQPDSLGQSCLLATRLVEHGVRFVSITHDGWDTHTDNFEGHKKLLAPKKPFVRKVSWIGRSSSSPASSAAPPRSINTRAATTGRARCGP
jgi:hypothetical protein